MKTICCIVFKTSGETVIKENIDSFALENKVNQFIETFLNNQKGEKHGKIFENTKNRGKNGKNIDIF